MSNSTNTADSGKSSGGLQSPAVIDEAATLLFRIMGLTSRAATSSLGLVTAYLGALAAAVLAFRNLQKPLAGWPLGTRLTLVAAVPILMFIFHTIPTILEQRRRRRLIEISGTLHGGYFRLAPRKDEDSFTRADAKHEEVLNWLLNRDQPRVLFLTGASGSGKTSILQAWILPHLKRQGTIVITLRGYQDPLETLGEELRKPGVIWQRRSLEKTETLSSLLALALHRIRPRRLLVVLDQFEEFVILHNAGGQQRFEQFFSNLLSDSSPHATFLFVFRSEYVGLIENLGLPPLMQDVNWKEVPPFTERDANAFMRGSGLQVSDRLLADVLREAADIEQATGLIRPVTINLCGLVLGRFAGGLPRRFRPGSLIRGFLRDAVFQPSIREISPKVLPKLITDHVTKRPRTLNELARDSGLNPEEVRGYMRILGHSDRAIVRPLDAEQQVWEISHDFLVPLLDSIIASWRVSFWRQGRKWFPWIAATTLAIAAVAVANWRQNQIVFKENPIVDLTNMGWTINKTADGYSCIPPAGEVPKGSAAALMQIHVPLTIKLLLMDDSVSQLREVTIAELDLGVVNGSNLEPLRGFTNLAALDLSNAFPDIPLSLEPLSTATNLTKLNLSNMNFTNIESLKALTNLRELNLSRTAVRDLEPLKGLINLTELNLSGTDVSDLQPLTGLINLTDLDLSNTEVSNLGPLEGLKNLTRLDLTGGHLRGPELRNLEPLRGLTNLTRLDLSNTGVSGLEPLKGLTRLSELDLSRNPEVRDLEPLRGLTNLTRLNCDMTKVSNVEPLKGLERLTELFLRETQVSQEEIDRLKSENKNLQTAWR